MSAESAPTIKPLPPVADEALPWDSPVPDTVAQLTKFRDSLGDTFVIDSGQDRYLFLFSGEGIRGFYDVAEEHASKGIADWKMLRRKLPDDVFAGRRTLPHELFGRSEVAMYLGALEAAIDRQLDELGSGGVIDVFDFSRTLGHRLGLASWAGIEVLDHPRFDELVAALDVLDPSESFVDPALMDRVAASGKRAERRALEIAEVVLGEVFDERRAAPTRPGDLLDTIIERWSDTEGAAFRSGVARDVILVHLGSMSNMFAALAWSIIHLTQHPSVLQRVIDGEEGLLPHCVLESTRIAQRSIMLRTVLTDIEIDDGSQRYSVEAGATLATFLPLTNLGGDLADYDPHRWTRGRLATPPAEGVETVTTFGHGAHACPARPYSMQAMCRVVERLVAEYELGAPSDPPRQRPGQIGGVARGAGPAYARWTKRTRH